MLFLHEHIWGMVFLPSGKNYNSKTYIFILDGCMENSLKIYGFSNLDPDTSQSVCASHCGQHPDTVPQRTRIPMNTQKAISVERLCLQRNHLALYRNPGIPVLNIYIISLVGGFNQPL